MRTATFDVNKVLLIDALSKFDDAVITEKSEAIEGAGAKANEIENREALLYETTKILKRFGDYKDRFLPLQETLYYYVGCLYFKVHNYSEARNCYDYSKRLSSRVKTD